MWWWENYTGIYNYLFFRSPKFQMAFLSNILFEAIWSLTVFTLTTINHKIAKQVELPLIKIVYILPTKFSSISWTIQTLSILSITANPNFSVARRVGNNFAYLRAYNNLSFWLSKRDSNIDKLVRLSTRATVW